MAGLFWIIKKKNQLINLNQILLQIMIYAGLNKINNKGIFFKDDFYVIFQKHHKFSFYQYLDLDLGLELSSFESVLPSIS